MRCCRALASIRLASANRAAPSSAERAYPAKVRHAVAARREASLGDRPADDAGAADLKLGPVTFQAI